MKRVLLVLFMTVIFVTSFVSATDYFLSYQDSTYVDDVNTVLDLQQTILSKKDLKFNLFVNSEVLKSELGNAVSAFVYKGNAIVIHGVDVSGDDKSLAVDISLYLTDMGISNLIFSSKEILSDDLVDKMNSIDFKPIEPKENRCTETDSGLDIYTRGESKGPWLDNINGPLESGEDYCSDANSNLQEYNCERLSSGSKVYGLVVTGVECPKGCSDGACIPDSCKDTDDGDYPFIKGSVTIIAPGIFDIDDDTCVSSNSLAEQLCKNGQQKTRSHDCALGCKNGACIPEPKPEPTKKGYRHAYWECYDGKEFKSVDDTSCKLPETWKKYATEFCEDRCYDDGSKCGVNSFSINVECYYGDDNILIVGPIPYDDEPKEVEEPELIDDVLLCKNSCPLDSKCYPFGYRKSGEYCSDKGVFDNQFDAPESCDNNFECSSNLCIDSQCISSSLWQKFLKWLGNWFG